MTAVELMTCNGPQCDRKVWARGLCKTHCGQMYSARKLTPIRPNDARKRFWQNVIKQGDGCWIWTASTRSSGRYGQFQRSGRQEAAHRISYEWANGPVPDGLVLDHLCRVTLCVNPDHLEVVTQTENVLRGTAPSAQHARQTHCMRGHELSGENIYPRALRERGARICVTCARDRARAAREARQQVAS